MRYERGFDKALSQDHKRAREIKRKRKEARDRLITIAPELLEVCKSTRAYLRNSPSPKDRQIAEMFDKIIEKVEKG